MEFYWVMLTIAILSSVLNNTGGSACDVEERLYNTIFEGYNKHVRPVKSYNKPIVLEFALYILQILDVLWRDENLQWNASDYSNISSIVVPFSNVWKPHVMLDNSVNGEYSIPPLDGTRLHHDGSIVYWAPATFHTPCIMDIKYFPFDSQQCHLKFGPWEHDAGEVVMDPIYDTIVKENFLTNSEWDWVSSSAKLITDVVDEHYSMIVFTITLRRRPLYYITNIVLPSIAMALLTVLVLCLPPESGEKMSFGVSLLVAISVFSVLVAGTIPTTSDSVPIIIQFLMFNLFLVTCSIIISVAVLRLHHRPAYNLVMPRWMRKLYLIFLPKVLLMKPYRSGVRGNTHNVRVDVEDEESLSTCQLLGNASSSKGKKPLLSNGNMKQKVAITDTFRMQLKRTAVEEDYTNNKILQMILAELQLLNGNINNSETQAEKLAEWRYMATVIDRFFFVLAMVAYLVGAVVLLTEFNNDELPHL
uniref:Neuronal acetylcholine receptor subunit alpha-6-like n=1 Tax=Saccoglossus kowalevskii TaxID=10224 RepID=A0ABM0MFG5_SACKO|nr:PREDICTED: neuronal acetylcholine receptor subunit alpha-6-like [Saccoglossus kowalevskii]